MRKPLFPLTFFVLVLGIGLACFGGGTGTIEEGEVETGVSSITFGKLTPDIAYYFDPLASLTFGKWDFEIHDQLGRPISGLTRDNFLLLMNGVRISSAGFDFNSSGNTYSIQITSTLKTGDHQSQLNVNYFGFNSIHTTDFTLVDPGQPDDTTDYRMLDIPTALIAEDFDNDARDDLIISTQTQKKINVLEGKLNGLFDQIHEFEAGSKPIDMVTGDFSADGHKDIAILQDAPLSNILILIGDSTARFTPDNVYTAGSQPKSIASADFNQDSHPDLVIADIETQDLQLMMGQGGGIFTGPLTTSANVIPFKVKTGGPQCRWNLRYRYR